MRSTTALAVAAVVTLGVAVPASAETGTAITMPALSGRHAVGTAELHRVDRRPDPWRPGQDREVMVTVTYPAHRSDAGRAPWMASGVAAVVAQEAAKPEVLGVPAGSVDWGVTRRHARTGAPVLGRWPVVLFSLSWQRMTRNGALAGMVVGALTVLLWKQSGSALYEMIPGVILASLAIVIASLLDRPPPADVQATHEQVRLTLRETRH